MAGGEGLFTGPPHGAVPARIIFALDGSRAVGARSFPKLGVLRRQ